MCSVCVYFIFVINSFYYILWKHWFMTDKKSFSTNSLKYAHAQLCLFVTPPMDCSPPDSSVHGIFQARILEWVATASSRGSSRPRDGTWVSCTGREDSLPLSLLGSPAWKTWLQGTKYLWGLKHTKVHFSPLKKNKECKITMNFFF